MLLLLQAGDVESNPGPKNVFRTCPNCGENMHVKTKLCKCGYVLNKKRVDQKALLQKQGTEYQLDVQ